MWSAWRTFGAALLVVLCGAEALVESGRVGRDCHALAAGDGDVFALDRADMDSGSTLVWVRSPQAAPSPAALDNVTLRGAKFVDLDVVVLTAQPGAATLTTATYAAVIVNASKLLIASANATAQSLSVHPYAVPLNKSPLKLLASPAPDGTDVELHVLSTTMSFGERVYTLTVYSALSVVAATQDNAIVPQRHVATIVADVVDVLYSSDFGVYVVATRGRVQVYDPSTGWAAWANFSVPAPHTLVQLVWGEREGRDVVALVAEGAVYFVSLEAKGSEVGGRFRGPVALGAGDEGRRCAELAYQHPWAAVSFEDGGFALFELTVPTDTIVTFVSPLRTALQGARGTPIQASRPGVVLQAGPVVMQCLPARGAAPGGVSIYTPPATTASGRVILYEQALALGARAAATVAVAGMSPMGVGFQQLALAGRSCATDDDTPDGFLSVWFSPVVGSAAEDVAAAHGVILGVAVLVSVAAVHAVRWLPAQGCVLCPGVRVADKYGAARFPYVPLCVFLTLLPGLAHSCLRLLAGAALPLQCAGGAALAACAAVPVLLRRRIRAAVPKDAFYALDPKGPEGGVALWICGAGEWVNASLTEQCVHRYSLLLTSYRQGCAPHWVALQAALSLTIAAAEAVPVASLKGCAAAKLANAGAVLCVLGATLYWRPCVRPFVNTLEVLTLLTLLAALVGMGWGYLHQAPPQQGAFVPASVFQFATLALLCVRFAMETAVHVHLAYVAGRRTRLQETHYAARHRAATLVEHPPGVTMSTLTVTAQEDHLDTALEEVSPAHMSRTALHTLCIGSPLVPTDMACAAQSHAQSRAEPLDAELSLLMSPNSTRDRAAGEALPPRRQRGAGREKEMRDLLGMRSQSNLRRTSTGRLPPTGMTPPEATPTEPSLRTTSPTLTLSFNSPSFEFRDTPGAGRRFANLTQASGSPALACSGSPRRRVKPAGSDPSVTPELFASPQGTQVLSKAAAKGVTALRDAALSDDDTLMDADGAGDGLFTPPTAASTLLLQRTADEEAALLTLGAAPNPSYTAPEGARRRSCTTLATPDMSPASSPAWQRTALKVLKKRTGLPVSSVHKHADADAGDRGGGRAPQATTPTRLFSAGEEALTVRQTRSGAGIDASLPLVLQGSPRSRGGAFFDRSGSPSGSTLRMSHPSGPLNLSLPSSPPRRTGALRKFTGPVGQRPTSEQQEL